METTQVKRIEFDENVVYQIGKTKAIINCTFRQDNKETVCTMFLSSEISPTNYN